MKAAAVIAAGGSGSRFENQVPKQFLPIHDKPLIHYTIEAFENTPSIEEIIIVLPETSMATFQDTVLSGANFKKIKKTVVGGNTRQDSVGNGLEAISEGIDVVAIHDADRCLITKDLIQKTLEG